MSIKVALADDHVVVRDGLKAILERKIREIEVIMEASNGKELLDLAARRQADVYIIDISMPVLNGIETTQRLVKSKPGSRIIVLSMHDDRASVERALKSGAAGFVIKGSPSDELVKAIKEVHAGKFYLSPKIAHYVVRGFIDKTSGAPTPSVSGLTPKEREVLQLLAEGNSSREIAKQLDLALNTVHVHRNNIMRKLDIHRQADLIRYALKEKIAHLE